MRALHAHRCYRSRHRNRLGTLVFELIVISLNFNFVMTIICTVMLTSRALERSRLFYHSALKPTSVISAPAPRPPDLHSVSALLVFSTPAHRSTPLAACVTFQTAPLGFRSTHRIYSLHQCKSKHNFTTLL